MRRPGTLRGFTLVELLVVIAILACLAGLLMPAVTNVRNRALCATCAGNLHAIGVSTLLYAGEHGQMLPVIEPWPSKPVYSSTFGAGSILEVLGPYGLTEKVLRCPADAAGTNFYAREKSSYQWFPGANNANLLSLTPENPDAWFSSPAKLFLAFDYTGIHGGLANMLFADGHVGGAITAGRSSGK